MPARLILLAVAAFLVAACSKAETRPSPVPSASATPVPSPTPEVVKPLPEPLPEIIAHVNGSPIPLRHARIMAEGATAGRPPSPELRARAYRGALEQLVTREVLFQEALAQKISADSAVVDREYDKAHAAHKDESEWKQFLTKQGLDPQSFKTELRTRLTVNALLQKVAAEVPANVSDEDAKKYYDANPALFQAGPRVRASHFLLLVPPTSDAKAKAAIRTKAEAALKRVRGGEEFAVVAGQVSEDSGSAVRGGELGIFGKGEMVPPFEEAAFALAPGAVSDIVETQFGFHVIKVHEKVPAETASFDRVKEQLKQHLVGLKRQEAVTLFVKGLREKAKIETYL